MSIQVSRILHAGYILKCQETVIAFDPIFENPFSQNCYAFPAVNFEIPALQSLKLDAVFISHYHDDHFSLESLKHLQRDIPIYMFSVFEELLELLKRLGFRNVHSAQLGRAISVGSFKITPLEALDADVDSIYHIQATDLNILNVVDSWIGPKTMDLLLKIKWDLVLWPMQTMREIEVLAPANAAPVTPHTTELPPEWLEQIQELCPRAIIPSSCQFRFEEWSWYNRAFFPISYQRFSEQIHEILPQTQIIPLSPGQSISLSTQGFQTASPLPWIHPVGPQDLDYTFDAEISPPPFREIAQKFPALDEKQKSFVRNFCETELLKRFSNLTVLEDSYFQIPRDWRLKVYDHEGRCTEHHYRVGPAVMTKIDESSGAWTTEISEAKIYGAVRHGESLTSVYIRVTNPENTDPLEDPLIRSLYEGVVGSYQKAQLLKIQGQS